MYMYMTVHLGILDFEMVLAPKIYLPNLFNSMKLFDSFSFPGTNLLVLLIAVQISLTFDPTLFFFFLFLVVGGRCIPTFADLDSLVSLVNTTQNFNESEVPDLTELAFELTLNDILNGTL